MWSLANQLQILMMLMLTGAYVPPQIEAYLSGQTFASFNFEFIPLNSIIDIKYNPIGIMDYNHTNEKLKAIGIESGSAFVNNSGLLFSIFIFMIFHLLFCCTPQWKEKEGESKKRKWMRRFRRKTNETLKWGVYLRLIIEAYLLLLIGTLAELSFGGTFTALKWLSIFISLLFIGALFLTLYLSYYYAKKNEKKSEANHNFKEFYSGLKSRKAAKFYMFYFLLRRTIIAFTVVYFNRILPVWHTLFIIVMTQLINILFLFKISPFEEFQDNLVEAINEHYFTFFLVAQYYLKTREDWNISKSNAYLYLLTSNNLTISLILICKY